MEVWNLWQADYWLSGVVKAVTAAASVPTAILLVRPVSAPLALPSSEKLRIAVTDRERTEARSRALLEASLLLWGDSRDDESLTQRALTKHGCFHKTTVLRGGTEALEYLVDARVREEVEIPERILLVLKLQKVDGLEMLRQLWACEDTKLLPLIILISSNEDQGRFHATLSANGYIRQPADFTEFSIPVREVGLWLGLNQSPLFSGRRS